MKSAGEIGDFLRGNLRFFPRNFFEFSGKLKNLLRESHLNARGNFGKRSAKNSNFLRGIVSLQ